ncbi:hypothetical protein [Bosea sp. RAC05]|uniref:hypothetical protein n=1 Tax=Bosea sp. RAC05 TaxID=1842539 RepID=UPI00083D2542|nr:hypothetical protein [Bosea sp. RAC05]
MSNPLAPTDAAGFPETPDLLDALDHLNCTRYFVDASILAAGSLSDRQERDALFALGAHVRDRLVTLREMLESGRDEVRSSANATSLVR